MTDMIETDYLVVGAGAAGLAFVDEVIARTDADVVMVDRRHQPGGHWVDAYPFVRLHQSSSNYGVNSLVLGTDSIDTSGPNAGFYERATGVEICAYYEKVLDSFLRTSRVRFYGGCEYRGDFSGNHFFTSNLTGRTTQVRVRRKIVDSTYLEVSVPATHTPPFSIDPAAHFIPVGDLVDVSGSPGGFTILGAGKTAMDACVWLQENGVDPDRIRWVKSRESWLQDRALRQPRDLLVDTVEGYSFAIEDMAEARDADDLFTRFEASGQLSRVDRTVWPTMYRGAILSQAEIDMLRRVERVVRLGRVKHLGADRMVLERGTLPSDAREVYVDCTAAGFRTAPGIPIFEPGTITLQSLLGGFTTFNSAIVGFVEATCEGDAEKNRLCPPTPQPNQPSDWIRMLSMIIRLRELHAAHPGLKHWLANARLNLMHGVEKLEGDARMIAARARWEAHKESALKNASRMLSRSQEPSPAESRTARAT